MAPDHLTATCDFRLRAHPASGDELVRLAMRYATGQEGDPVDFLLAQTLFDLAALRGSLEAKVCRKALAARMDPADVAEAERMARDWLAQPAA